VSQTAPQEQTQTQWQSRVLSLSKFGTNGRNVAHSVARIRQTTTTTTTSSSTSTANGRTVVVGEFDSVVQISRNVTLRSPYPAAFIVMHDDPPSAAGHAVSDVDHSLIRWALQSQLTPRHKSDASTSAVALAVSVVADSGDVLVGGSFSAAAISFQGVDGVTHSLSSFASDSAAFLLRLTGDGRILWLTGPTVFELLYITALDVAPDTGAVYVGGFYQGSVFFRDTDVGLPFCEHVQGWLAKFEPDGSLAWLMSLLGAGRNVVADVALAPERSQLAVVGSYQADCTVTATLANGTVVGALTLDGMASRTVFLSALDSERGATLWTNAISDFDADNPAVTCDDHHYVEHAPQSGDLYVVGCFSGALNFSTAPASGGATATAVLDSGSPYNSIYIGRYAANGTLVWTQALLGDNISDYPFSAAVVDHPYIEAGELPTPVLLNEGLLISAFAQGGWRPLARADCAQVQAIVPSDAPYGALYATAIDQTGCSAWISLIAAGRAQPAGMVPLSDPASFALYGTFTGQVQFPNDRAISSVPHSADVFVCFFALEPAMTPQLEGFSHVLWQYSVAGAFGCLFLLAFACIGAMYWPSRPPGPPAGATALLAARDDDASAENSDEDPIFN